MKILLVMLPASGRDRDRVACVQINQGQLRASVCEMFVNRLSESQERPSQQELIRGYFYHLYLNVEVILPDPHFEILKEPNCLVFRFVG